MTTLDVWFRPENRPKLSLVVWYILWKLLLVCVALLSPGAGYDTSTTLLHTDPRLLVTAKESGWNLSARLSSLVRWDAIYFTAIARRGYSWEQEWAFGWGFTRLMALASKGLDIVGLTNIDGNEVAAGILISHVFHLLSVLMLHELTLTVYPLSSASMHSRLALLAASLHIITPAGMFLSAPYAESCFSFLNFSGCYLYVNTVGSHHKEHGIRRDLLIVLAGLLFGLATLFRGNGLVSGLVLVYDALDCVMKILQSTAIGNSFRRLIVISVSGILMALIASLPQYLAYEEYCSSKSADSPVRPWCFNWVPSIYAWVQKEYWGVALFGYWTLSNLPLFILAAPMLCILLQSGYWIWNEGHRSDQLGSERMKDGPTSQSSICSPDTTIDNSIAYRIAIPQIVLAGLAFMLYHVQIITRLASGYPVWYWWLATLMIDDGNASLWGRKFRPAGIITRWMVLYAIVQGGLFASFLPPA